MDYTSCRLRTDNQGRSVTVDWNTTENGTTVDKGSVVAGWVGRNRSIWDYPHPGYHRRRKNGEVIMGDLDIAVEERSESTADWSVNFLYNGKTRIEHRWGAWAQWFISKFPAPTSFAPNVSSMRDAALIKAYAQMNRSDIMAGELFGDLNQTISMLRHPFRSSANLLNRMVRARNRRIGRTAASAARAASDAWLEYRYGWKPLLLDIQTIIQDSHKIRDRIVRQRLVARASESWNGQRVNTVAGASWSPEWTLSGTVEQVSNYSASAGVLYEVDPSTLFAESSRFYGAQARDLVPTAWELVPYSFVVDWFVDVGSWIQAITPRPGIRVVDNWATSVQKETYVYNELLTHKYGSPQRVATVSIPPFVKKTTNVRRRCRLSIPNLPVPSQNSLSTLHSVDSLALSLQPIIGGLKAFHR